MEGVVSMPASHTPSLLSLLSTFTQEQAPVSAWMNEMSSEPEIRRFLLSIQGFPSTWLNWADKKIKLAELRGDKVRSRSGYALSSIWNGLSIVQECKFSCDTLENSLRFAFIFFVSQNRIPAKRLFKTSLINKVRKRRPGLFSLADSHIDRRLIFEMDFSELTEMMAENWKVVSTHHRHKQKHIIGFGSLFWSSVHCRDVKLFKKHMRLISNIRNTVAHSRHLLSHNDFQRLRRIIDVWLKPLNVELMQRIGTYHGNQPKFLKGLNI
jgi:hypothetical protein